MEDQKITMARAAPLRQQEQLPQQRGLLMTSQMLLYRIVGLCRAMRLSRALVSSVLLTALAVGGAVGMRVLRPAAPTQIEPGQALAWKIARAAGSSEGVQLASGSYLPGDRLLLYTRTGEADRDRVRGWAILQLAPFVDQLAELPAEVKLVWVIDFGPPPGEQELIAVPIRRAADSTAYSYVSSTPGLFRDSPVASTTEAQPAPVPTTEVQPTVGTGGGQPTEVPTAAGVQPAATNQAKPTAQPTADAQGNTTLLKAAFDQADASGTWLPLAGDWVMANGVYSQRDNSGFDFISMLSIDPQTHYVLEAKVRIGEGDMGGGFVYNVPDPQSRAGAQIVDFDNKGGFLRWGRYDDTGTYVYKGGVKLTTPISDGAWHDLRLVTHGATSTISLDGKQYGPIKNTSTSGYVGLITSKMKVDFDDATLTSIPEKGSLAP